jgi:hypothetical protein
MRATQVYKTWCCASAPSFRCQCMTGALTRLFLKIAMQSGEHECAANGSVHPGIVVVLCGEIRVTVDLSKISLVSTRFTSNYELIV